MESGGFAACESIARSFTVLFEPFYSWSFEISLDI